MCLEFRCLWALQPQDRYEDVEKARIRGCAMRFRRITEAFICDAIRTPIGRYGGILAKIRADDLGAVPMVAVGSDLTLFVQMLAKKANGLSSASANHTGSGLPAGPGAFSLNDVNGTRQRQAGPSQRRQCGLAVLRTLVTPLSTFLPCKAKAGDGMPQRAFANSRTPSGAVRTIGTA
jgi:hypothetical protein